MDEVTVLDHGYVRFIESWGSDERIIEAARMSTGKGFQGWGTVSADAQCQDCMLLVHEAKADETCVITSQAHRWDKAVAGDEKLLAYLYNNKHSTPFEMAGLVLEVKAPIFVFREWHRHRTQSYNEMSARYIPLPDENYEPTLMNIVGRIAAGGGNKQAGSASQHIPTDPEISNWLLDLQEAYGTAQRVYERGLDLGIPKELARLPVPVARYSRMRASANLRNWLAFLTLRTAPAAQWEIRQYANAVCHFVAERFPRTYRLFVAENTHAGK